MNTIEEMNEKRKHMEDERGELDEYGAYTERTRERLGSIDKERRIKIDEILTREDYHYTTKKVLERCETDRVAPEGKEEELIHIIAPDMIAQADIIGPEWIHPQSKEWKSMKVWINASGDENYMRKVESTWNDLKECKSQLEYLQTKLYNETVKDAADLNDTALLSRLKVFHEGTQPEPHPTIFDENLGTDRCCRNKEEQLKGTQQVHENWMDTTSAKKTCLFVDLTSDSAGISGATLHPYRKINERRCEQLVYNWRDLSGKVKEDFRRAYGPHMGKIFSPGKENHNLIYPFFLNEKGEFSRPDMEREFWRNIVKTPGKARHKSFTLNILGRLPHDWGYTMLKLIQLSLITRLPPNSIKAFTRIPIPKDVMGETRPIALTHDTFAYICALIAHEMMESMEKAGTLPEYLRAYRKNKATGDITLLEACMKEDILESGHVSARDDEDEEIFLIEYI